MHPGSCHTGCAGKVLRSCLSLCVHVYPNFQNVVVSLVPASLYFLSPSSIHPSIHPFLPSSPFYRIHLADPSPSFTPAPNREIFPYSRGIHRQLYESWKEINFRRFERVFQGDYYHPDAGTLGKFCVSGRIYRGSHLGAIKSWTSPALLSMGLTRPRELMWKMTPPEKGKPGVISRERFFFTKRWNKIEPLVWNSLKILPFLSFFFLSFWKGDKRHESIHLEKNLTGRDSCSAKIDSIRD